MNSFAVQLERAVVPARGRLFDTKFFSAVRGGTLTKTHYSGFLRQVYHYASHTPRLLAAAAARLPADAELLFQHFMHNAHEETGHHRLALQDLHTMGVDTGEVLESRPLPATEAPVAV